MLSHAPRRELDNFYQNSFKQLSMIQQKQVGLLVGAAVADAAARPLNGYSPEEVQAYVQRVYEANAAYAAASPSSSATTTTTTRSAAEDAVAFARVAPRGVDVLGDSSVSSATDATPMPLLQHHSFSYLLFFEMLRAINAMRGEAALADVQAQLVRVATAVQPTQLFEQEHASLLNTLCCLLPTPAIYPYASDAALREYVEPFADFLTTTSSASPAIPAAAATPARGSEESDAEGFSAEEAAEAERFAVRDYTFSALGVVLRNLQSNPDATRNGAFMAAPGTSAIFPADVQAFVPALTSHANNAADAVAADHFGKQREHLWKVQQRLAAQPSRTGAPRWLPLRCTAKDALVVQESLTIARAPVSFAKGVVQAIHLGGPTCQRAMLVGALLGAKLGVRHVPLTWLSATPDHQPVATMAMEVSQVVWNSPRS